MIHESREGYDRNIIWLITHANDKLLSVCLEKTKVLGLEWHPGGDSFCWAISLNKSSIILTKRSILSLVAFILQPGFFGKAVFIAKIVIQRTFLQDLWWDESLPLDIREECVAFVLDIPSLRHIKVPRYIILGLAGESCVIC